MTRSDASPWVPDSPTLPALRDAVQTCEGCDLYRDATQGVMGAGSRSAELMIVGEQPGDQEDLVGEPFVGPAGRLLDKALAAAGIAPDLVYRTNVVKHFRFSGTPGKARVHKSPARWHVAACEPWLLAELDVVRPRGVVLLGSTAGVGVFGSGFRLGPNRGRLLDWPKPEHHQPDWVLATLHPSAVLRSPNRTEDLITLVADLKAAEVALRGC